MGHDVGAIRERARAQSEPQERALMDLLAIQSISTLPDHAEDCRRAAAWLGDRLQAIGLENVEVIRGIGHPLVYADWRHAQGKPTILLYGHYDVQPVDPIDEWTTPPFTPTVRDGFVYARGAADDKGQMATFVEAAAAYLADGGELPVNLRFILEGEEECGGAHIKQFLAEHPERLQADFAQVADASFFAPDVPSIDTGLRGVVYTEVTVRGAACDLHSGLYGGVGPNPLMALALTISRLRDPNGHITIPGFYDSVRMPPDEIRQAWRELGMTPEKVAQDIGARGVIGEAQYTPLERMWALPTLDVHGIRGGFVGEGAKTVIPAVASAKISMRIVPDQRAADVFELFRAAVEQFTPDQFSVDVQLIRGDDPVVVPSDTPEVRAAQQALSEVWGRPAVLTRSGGSIPVVGLLQEHLGIPTVLTGYGFPGDNLHAPNEHFSLEQFHKGIEANIVFWDLVGR